MLLLWLHVTRREALFVRQKSNSFLNPILESEYSDSIYAYDAVLNEAFKNICDKLCNMDCDISERLIDKNKTPMSYKGELHFQRSAHTSCYKSCGVSDDDLCVEWPYILSWTICQILSIIDSSFNYHIYDIILQ